jgi:hypothetical protein
MISGDGKLKNKQISSKVETMMRLESAVETLCGKEKLLASWDTIKMATF